MSNGMSLDQILNELKQVAPAEKTAAATPAEPSKIAQAKTDLQDALKRAETAVKTATPATEKQASANPGGELQKLASDLAAADQEALVKEAQFYGAAVADGFMSRLKQYETATESLPSTKTANNVDVEKIAGEAVRGYVETQTRIKQAAADEFKKGYNDTLQEVEKIASDVFASGAQDCANVLQQLSAQQ